MENYSKIAVVLLTFIFMGGCSTLKNVVGLGNSSDTEPASTGAFIVRAQTQGITETANNIARSQAVVSNGVQKTYGIGNLKASRTISFLIGNSGDEAINNISITSSSNYLTFTPSTFQVLDGGDSASFELFDIGIEHGVAINGIGYVDILTMGEHLPTFNVTGITEGEATISSTYQLTFNAKVAAFELIVGGTTKDISVGDTTTSGVYGGIARGDIFWTYNQGVNIRNVGNVDLNIRLLGHGVDENNVYSTYTVPQGQTVIINTPLSPFNQWVEVDGNNAVFDFDRYDVGNNGKAYFELLDINP